MLHFVSSRICIAYNTKCHFVDEVFFHIWKTAVGVVTSYTKLFCESKKHTLLIIFSRTWILKINYSVLESLSLHKVKNRDPTKFCSTKERIIILNKILIYNLLCSAVQCSSAEQFFFLLFLMPVRIDSLVVVCLQIHGYYISSANRVEKPSRSPPISAFALEWLLSKLSIRSI